MLVAAALAVGVAGCQNRDATNTTTNDALPPSAASTTPMAQVPPGDPSLPDASAVVAALDAADKAKAMQETAALQKKPAPQEKMTKGEESKAMPLPGQANDHSTTALDKRKGG
jgi:hypothetical protein